MMLKKPKEQVLQDINSMVFGMVSSQLSNHTYSGRLDLNNLQYAIQNAITAGVTEGFRVMIDNIYSDAEFEEDMKLR